MLKIFVTGDNHIGMTYANHSAREKIIEERIAAFSVMVDKANDEGCDLFAITGDLFENTEVDSKSVKAVANILADFNGYVAVLPGNHDYYDGKAEVWKIFSDAIANKDRIVLLRDETAYDYGKFVIYPSICKDDHSAAYKNGLDWIKRQDIPNDGKYRIGMAHGNIEGEALDDEGKYYPMTRDELNAIGVDVWLIGHIHVPFPKGLTEEFSPTEHRIFNAGSHVQVHVKNNTEGCCFILEIDENKNIRAKRFVSGKLRFYRREIEVVSGKLEETLTRELSGYRDESSVEITVKGAVSDEEYNDRGEIVKKVCGRFWENEIHDEKLFPHITKEVIEKRFHEQSLYAKMLNRLISDPKQTYMAFDLLDKYNKPTEEGRK